MTKLLPYLTIMAQGELFPKCHLNKPVRSAIDAKRFMFYFSTKDELNTLQFWFLHLTPLRVLHLTQWFC